MRSFEIYEEGYIATGETCKARYIGSADGETFLDACKNYISKTGYGEIYKVSGKEYAGNYGCFWYPTLEESQKNFG